ncbi:MAG: hypothetical protein R3E39_26810 [Anaerolineae bacterium]
MIHRVFAGVGISTITIIFNLAAQLVAVPIFLTHWGQEIYGEWLTLTSLVAGISILNLGVQTYVGNILIAHYERKEIERGTLILHAALRLYLTLCGLAVAVTFGLVLFPSLLEWLNIHTIKGFDARTIVLVQGAIASYAILGGLLLGLLRVTRQVPRQLTYGLVERVIIIGAPVIVVLLGGQPVVASLAVGALIAIVASVAVRDVWRRTPFRLGISGASWRDARALLKPSVVFLAVTLAAQLLSNGMILIISTGIGAAAVTLYSTTLMLTNFVRIIVNQSLNVLWPEVTAAAATAEAGRLMRWHRLIVKLVSGLSLIIAAGLMVLGSEVLAVWTRGKVPVDPLLNILLTLYLLIEAPSLVSGMFGLATNHQGDMFRADLGTAIVAVVIAILLVPTIGLRGVGVGLVIAQVVNTMWVMRMSCEWTGDTWPVLLEQWLIRGLPAFISTAVFVAGISVLQLSIVGQLAGLGVAIVVCVGLGWTIWLNAEERQTFLNIIRSVSNRISVNRVDRTVS